MQLIHTCIVTIVNLVRFYTKIRRIYVHLLKSVQKGAVWNGMINSELYVMLYSKGEDMKTSGSNFELIMQEVLKQKQLLEDLLSENDELHHQLAELREGRGIFVDIPGKRFPLVDVPVSDSPNRIAIPDADLSLQETTEILSESLPTSIPETPVTAFESSVEEAQEDLPTYITPTMSSYLEEAMLDEFSAAATREMGQVAVWSGPITNPPTFDEKEKENLRRELSGSFLLE
jgi:hypothetical protein